MSWEKYAVSPLRNGTEGGVFNRCLLETRFEKGEFVGYIQDEWLKRTCTTKSVRVHVDAVETQQSRVESRQVAVEAWGGKVALLAGSAYHDNKGDKSDAFREG